MHRVRWQSAENKRKRALEAAAIVRYLQEFANSPGNFSGLSELFHSDDRLAEAAVSLPPIGCLTAGRLLLVCCAGLPPLLLLLLLMSSAPA